jgi:hypothetical protein
MSKLSESVPTILGPVVVAAGAGVPPGSAPTSPALAASLPGSARLPSMTPSSGSSSPMVVPGLLPPPPRTPDRKEVLPGLDKLMTPRSPAKPTPKSPPESADKKDVFMTPRSPAKPVPKSPAKPVPRSPAKPVPKSPEKKVPFPTFEKFDFFDSGDARWSGWVVNLDKKAETMTLGDPNAEGPTVVKWDKNAGMWRFGNRADIRGTFRHSTDGEIKEIKDWIKRGEELEGEDRSTTIDHPLPKFSLYDYFTHTNETEDVTWSGFVSKIDEKKGEIFLYSMETGEESPTPLVWDKQMGVWLDTSFSDLSRSPRIEGTFRRPTAEELKDFQDAFKGSEVGVPGLPSPPNESPPVVEVIPLAAAVVPRLPSLSPPGAGTKTIPQKLPGENKLSKSPQGGIMSMLPTGDVPPKSPLKSGGPLPPPPTSPPPLPTVSPPRMGAGVPALRKTVLDTKQPPPPPSAKAPPKPSSRIPVPAPRAKTPSKPTVPESKAPSRAKTPPKPPVAVKTPPKPPTGTKPSRGIPTPAKQPPPPPARGAKPSRAIPTPTKQPPPPPVRDTASKPGIVKKGGIPPPRKPKAR